MNCKNCHKELNETQKFCDDCGAKIIQNRLTPRVLLTQVNEQFLSIDNTFLRTFIALFKKPEIVIDGYINGLRKRYINVITYYAIALTVLGFQMFILKEFFPDFLNNDSNAFGNNIKVNVDGVKNPFESYLGILTDYQGIMFSIFMPFIAVGTWLIYIDKRKYNYTEHLVINLYLSAQTIYFNFIILISLALFNTQNFLLASLISTPPTILYGAYILKKLYKTSFFNALVRYVIAYLIYIIVFTIVMAIIGVFIVIYLFSTGKLNL